MSETCGCCDGMASLTPESRANRPGLGVLRYRVGTHGSFLETMKAALSGDRSLNGKLTARDDDPSIALLDAWATVADVLTFYQARIANEGYLRTASERRSIIDLARLVGYRLRPGVAASVYLAYEIDPTEPAEVLIPAGARAQSVPGPGEQAQMFETSEPLRARAMWNTLPVQVTARQVIDSSKSAIDTTDLYFAGTRTNLRPNDMLLFVMADGNQRIVRRVATVKPEAGADRTAVTLQRSPLSKTERGPLAMMARHTPSSALNEGGKTTTPPQMAALQPKLRELFRSPSAPPPAPAYLPRDTKTTFASTSGTAFDLVNTGRGPQRDQIATFLNNWPPAPLPYQVFAMRVKAAPFGHDAPGQFTDLDPKQEGTLLHLDGEYPAIETGGFAVIEAAVRTRRAAPHDHDVYRVNDIRTDMLSTSGLTGIRVTALELDEDWTSPEDDGLLVDELRSRMVYLQSEALEMARAPVAALIEGDSIDLETYVGDLEPGRWIIIAGERADITAPSQAEGKPSVAVPGLRVSELVMLAGVDHIVDSPGDTPHSRLRLGQTLAFKYRRDTVTVQANVVKATHGETRSETLGSGDQGKALQSFVLRDRPLTFIATPAAAGVKSTLHVRVNDVEWSEADDIADLAPTDRRFVTLTDDDDRTTIIFGNGIRGGRLPTGQENISAAYRIGIGQSGNVGAEQISLLSTRPAGVKGVVNPQPASGGANRDTLEHARRNAPLAIKALDRLVSVQDYADFARSFAGIGKAVATEISDGQRQVVHVTVAGLNDAPIRPESDLFKALKTALNHQGDPLLPVRIGIRELLLIIVRANVRIRPEYRWETVESTIRASMTQRFGFDARELIQTTAASEIIAAIHEVPGVAYVDLDVFDAIDEPTIQDNVDLVRTPVAGTSFKPQPVTVKAGDNLFRIAKSERALDGVTTVERIADTNNIENIRVIRPGQVLRIPMPSLSDLAIRLAYRRPARIEVLGARRFNHYTVRSFDTLTQIGERFGVDVVDIQRINGIADANANVIALGQVLRIPPAGGFGFASAQIAYLTPAVPDTLILNQITEPGP